MPIAKIDDSPYRANGENDIYIYVQFLYIQLGEVGRWKGGEARGLALAALTYLRRRV